MKKIALAFITFSFFAASLFAQPVLEEVLTTNVSCNGFSDGSATIRISGGTAPYTYTIFYQFHFYTVDNVLDTFYTFNNIEARTWNVLVEDVNNDGFSVFKAAVVSQPAPISITDVSVVPITCTGAADAEIHVTATGESGNYMYELNPGSQLKSTGDFEILGPNTYTVTVTDAGNCLTSDVTDPITISDPALISIASVSPTNPTCYQADNGTISIVANGGTPPYTYTLNPGAIQTNTTGTFNNLAPDNYTVEVSDVNSCLPATSNPVLLTEPDELIITSAITTNNSCLGEADGEIIVTASGGTGPYKFTLNPGNISNNTGTFAGLSEGNYSVTVTDANSCGPVTASSLEIVEPDAISISSVSFDNISCNGSGDGEIRVIATGGTLPLNYTLNPGNINQATGTFGTLGGGNYTVTVNDANGCPPATTNQVTIIDPDPISISTVSSANISCKGAADGNISVSATGGTGTLTYFITPGASSNTTGIFTGLTPGNYTIEVRDENSCPPASTTPIQITEPEAISASVLPTSNLMLDCNNGSDGSIDVTISGGTPPYQLSWTGPGNYSSSQEDISNLIAGTYTLSMRDAKGCTLSPPLTATIAEPPAIAVLLAKTDVVCHGDADGTITVSASGGTPGYQYSRDNINWQVSNVFSGLSRNNYTIFVRDANLCVASGSILVNEPDELLVSSESRIDNNKCYGDMLGEIRILEVEGGTIPYQYSIDGGVNFFPSSTFQNLGAGSYQTVVKDAKECTASGNLNIINEPSEIIISSYNQVNVTRCFGSTNGKISIEATGGTGPKQYSLDGVPMIIPGIFDTLAAGSHLISIVDSNLCKKDTLVTLLQPSEIHFTNVSITHITTCADDLSGAVSFSATGGSGVYQYAIDGGTFGSSSSFAGLAAGNHTLSVLDGFNCQKDTLIRITSPSALSIQSQAFTPVTCNGAGNGSITVTASGGTPAYTFTLQPAGTVQNNGSFTGLGPGNYTVEVTDSKGCGPLATTSITITEPSALAVDSLISLPITCAGAGNGEIRVYPSGGTPPYQVSINNGASFLSQTTFTNLSPRVYQVIIKDANGCTLPAGNVPFSNPPALTIVTETKTDITTCFGDPTGTITFTVTGGTGSIEYSIDNGSSWQGSGTFPSLVGGDYTIIAKDESECTISSSQITIAQPTAITATITTTPYTDETSKGSLTISDAAGGTGTLEFSISGPTGTFSSQTVYTDLDAGLYPVVIRDENGCLYEEDAIVNQIIPLDVTISVTHISCYGYGDGSISISVSNATGQAEYSIDGGTTWSSTNSFEALGPGTYEVWVKDEDNRYFTGEAIINEPLELSIFRNITPATCNAFSNDGAIDVTLIGANGTVSYEWSNGSTSEDLENIEAGDYQLTATDENNCSISEVITVSAKTNINADAGADTAVCFGDALSLDGKGGTTIRWTPTTGLSNPNIANPRVETVANISYVLRVEGVDECYNLDTVNITVYPRLGLSAGNDTTVVESQSVIINTTGGPYVSYQWEPAIGVDDPASDSPEISILETTTYIVSAETDMGCVDRDTITIKLADRLIVYNAFSPNDDGKNDYFDIEYAWLYPQITVEVFNRWGERLFSSKGYTDDKRWNGTFKGRDVPLGTYYYVIVPYPGATPLTGPVTIVR